MRILRDKSNLNSIVGWWLAEMSVILGPGYVMGRDMKGEMSIFCYSYKLLSTTSEFMLIR